MFKKKMLVATNSPEIKISGTTASVKFEQTWESGTYKDKGDKVLDLALEDRKLRIICEEMLYSKKIPINNMTNNSFGIVSKVTSIKNKDCNKISKKMSSYFDNRKLDRSECYAPNSWRLFTVVGGEYYWLEIAYRSSLWSTEDEVVIKGQNRFGNFQSTDFEQVEWRMTTTGEVRSLIFPVVAQDSEQIDKNIYRFFIIRLTDNIPCFSGVAKTINEARDIADKSNDCIFILPKRTIPRLDKSN